MIKHYQHFRTKGYCVYFLVRQCAIVYIGVTTTLASRADQHIKTGKRFDHILFREFETESKARHYEKVKIVLLKPEYNLEKDKFVAERLMIH